MDTRCRQSIIASECLVKDLDCPASRSYSVRSALWAMYSHILRLGINCNGEGTG